MKRPVVVAEVGINHNGDLDRALRMVCLAKTMGADFVKFQTRVPYRCYKESYLAKKRDSKWGVTVRDEKIGLEFSEEQYRALDLFCTRQGIGWFSSPRDVESVRFLEKFHPPYMKIASGCLPNKPMIEEICRTRIPIILATGMAYASEIDEGIRFIDEHNGRIAYILHAVSLYPQPRNQMNMARIATLKRQYGHLAKIGFSNHSKSIIYCVQAAILGAEMIEFHFTEDRELPGPDHQASIGPTGFKRIMDHLASLEDSMGDGNINPSEEELSKGSNYLWR